MIMTTIGVNVAVLREGRLLLTRREDVEVWCLPGGSVDAGESIAEAAIRETREETGLEVVLSRLVGIYSMPAWRIGSPHIVLFAARPMGGTLSVDPDEVLDAGFFAPASLPEPLLWFHRQRIADALAGVGGAVAWKQEQPWPFDEDMTRRQFYARRDNSELSRQEFFLTHFDEHMSNEIREVGPESE